MHGLTVVGVPRLPRWLLFLRIAIIVLSLGVLVAAAYNISLFDKYIGITSSPAGFLIFDAIFTWLILGAMLFSELFAPAMYFRLAFFVFLILDCIFWLAAWAWSAQWAGWLGGLRRLTGSRADNFYNGFYGSITAGAVLGAFIWVMLIVLVTFFAMACLKDGEGGPQPGHANDAELGQRKPEDVQAYPQQPPPQQTVPPQ